MAISPEQLFLISEMKEMGIDKETTAAAATFLKTKEEIRSMWNWMRSLEQTPSQADILSKVRKIIEES